MRGTLVLAFLFLALLAKAQQMNVSVDGVASFDGANFTISEAGEDFATTIESEASVFVSVSLDDELNKKVNPNQKWRIEIAKEDLIWESDVRLEIIRTGDGYGHSNNKNQIFEGTVYQIVDGVSRYFFRGRGEVTEIPLQLKLSGFSVTQGAQDFETNVVLTIYDD